MDKFHQELFGVLTRARPRQSKAASLQTPCNETVTISQEEYRQVLNRYRELVKNGHLHDRGLLKPVGKSKAASVLTPSYVNQAQVIHNFITR
jgi:hypothetical protein